MVNKYINISSPGPRGTSGAVSVLVRSGERAVGTPRLNATAAPRFSFSMYNYINILLCLIIKIYID